MRKKKAAVLLVLILAITILTGPFTALAESAIPRNRHVLSEGVTNGITNGTSDTTFSPDINCTRGQIATFLYRDMK